MWLGREGPQTSSLSPINKLEKGLHCAGLWKEAEERHEWEKSEETL